MVGRGKEKEWTSRSARVPLQSPAKFLVRSSYLDTLERVFSLNTFCEREGESEGPPGLSSSSSIVSDGGCAPKRWQLVFRGRSMEHGCCGKPYNASFLRARRH